MDYNSLTKKQEVDMQQENFDFDIKTTQEEVNLKLKNSPEVIQIANKVDLNNLDSVTNFGQETAGKITIFADKVLNSINSSSVEDSGNLLRELNKIMEKFDSNDFKERKKGLLEKIFNKTKNTIESLFQKYNIMGTEMDRVYVQLKKYENEIKVSNNNLEQMFSENMDYYEALEKYVVAGQLVTEKIQNEIVPQLEAKWISTNEQVDQINLSNANQLLEMMQQRVFDLELAKNVSLQSMPQIKMIQKGNYNLIRKINSAFIITIPIFKQSLIQAITLKRQAIQAQAMAALDEKTNELLLRNAENTVVQSKLAAQLSGGSSIKIETIEKTWATIMKGIEETSMIQEQMKQQRIEGSKRLGEIQKEIQNYTKK